MKPSIVIPCYTEAKTIRAIVDCVCDASLAAKSIITADDCFGDGIGDPLSDALRRRGISSVASANRSPARTRAARTGATRRTATGARTFPLNETVSRPRRSDTKNDSVVSDAHSHTPSRTLS